MSKDTINQQTNECDSQVNLFQDEESAPSTSKAQTKQTQPKVNSAKSRRKEKRISITRLSKAILNYFHFLFEHLVFPNSSRHPHHNRNKYYGYVTLGILTLGTALTLNSLVGTLFTTYDWISAISILPIIDVQYNSLVFFVKILVIAFIHYFALPTIIFLVKRYILHRTNSYHLWITKYSGMNVISLLLILAAGLMITIQPILMLGVTFILLALLIISQIVTACASYYRTMNETKIDNIYLSLGTLSIHFFILIIVTSVLF